MNLTRMKNSELQSYRIQCYSMMKRAREIDNMKMLLFYKTEKENVEYELETRGFKRDNGNFILEGEWND